MVSTCFFEADKNCLWLWSFSEVQGGQELQQACGSLPVFFVGESAFSGGIPQLNQLITGVSHFIGTINYSFLERRGFFWGYTSILQTAISWIFAARFLLWDPTKLNQQNLGAPENMLVQRKWSWSQNGNPFRSAHGGVNSNGGLVISAVARRQISGTCFCAKTKGMRPCFVLSCMQNIASSPLVVFWDSCPNLWADWEPQGPRNMMFIGLYLYIEIICI